MIWLLPSAIALLMKGFLFFYSDVHKKKYFLIFLVSTFLLNSIELLGFFRTDYDLIVLKLYYCTAIFTFFYLAIVCSDISQSCRWMKNDLALVTASILAVTIFLTDYIVVDFTPLPNGSITKIAGEYYFIFQFYAFSVLLLALGLLIRRLITSNSHQVKVQSSIALLAFTPFILVILSLLLLMQLGYQINMVGFVSLATSFMLFILIGSNDRHKLFDMMQFVPFSRERQHHLEQQRILRTLRQPIIGEEIDLKMQLKELEALVIRHTQNYFTTQKEVARILNISESTISRKVDKNRL